MKIAIEVESDPISMVLKTVLGTISDCAITNADEADLVIANHHDKLLSFLKQGKRVFQFLCWNESPATGLLTAPTFADRFRIFVAVEGMKGLNFPGFPAMLTEIEKIRKELEQ